MEVKRVHIYTTGDPSIGIGGEGAEIVATGDFLFDTDDFAPEDFDDVRQELAGLFGNIWGERPHVMFDFEEEV